MLVSPRQCRECHQVRSCALDHSIILPLFPALRDGEGTTRFNSCRCPELPEWWSRLAVQPEGLPGCSVHLFEGLVELVTLCVAQELRYRGDAHVSSCQELEGQIHF